MGERVADDYPDLWDCCVSTAIDTSPSSTFVQSFVWTGTLPGGRVLGSPFVLGSSLAVGKGESGVQADPGWIRFGGAFPASFSFPLYGISSVLEVPSAQSTPEPSSLLGFITLGGLMLGAAVRRAKK